MKVREIGRNRAIWACLRRAWGQWLLKTADWAISSHWRHPPRGENDAGTADGDRYEKSPPARGAGGLFGSKVRGLTPLNYILWVVSTAAPSILSAWSSILSALA